MIPSCRPAISHVELLRDHMGRLERMLSTDDPLREAAARRGRDVEGVLSKLREAQEKISEAHSILLGFGDPED